MKEITKQQVIELMDKINRDGIDNTHYEIGRASCRERV